MIKHNLNIIYIILFFKVISLSNNYNQKEYFSLSCSKNFPTINIEKKQSGNSYNFIISKNYLIGNFSLENDSNFFKIPAKYSIYRHEYIHKLVYDSLINMILTAEKDNIKLKIVSATRTFKIQKSLWEQKIPEKYNIQTIKNVLKYTAMPGTSRHHWGTDIDFNSTQINYFDTFEGKKVYNWLKNNAPRFGFYQVYTNKHNFGYNEEKWHWSFLPLAINFQIEFKKQITYEDLNNFRGSEYARELNIFENYVFGIDSIFLKY